MQPHSSNFNSSSTPSPPTSSAVPPPSTQFASYLDPSSRPCMAMISAPSSPLIPTIILLCLPAIFFSAPRFLPRQISISAPDELDDLSLFNKVIAMDSANFRPHPRLPSTRSHLSCGPLRRPKIAFLFLTNSDFHFAFLWERFFSSNLTSKSQHLYNIYIHADPNVKINPLDVVFKNKIIPSKQTQRSSPLSRLSDPPLLSFLPRANLMGIAMLDDPSNAYSLVSQNCVPLHSFNYLFSFLFDLGRLSRGLEFSSYIEILDDPNLLDRYNARGENVMHFNEFRVGSQLFVLTRKHALTVIKDRNLWRKFKLPCLNQIHVIRKSIIFLHFCRCRIIMVVPSTH